jgi:acetyl esterase/lipase
LLFCACGRHGGDAALSAQIYARWFVEPTAGRADSLMRCAANGPDLQQVAERARRQSAGQPGTGVATLRDINAAGYALGYATPKRFRPDTTYPLIVYLHGGIGSASPDKGSRAYEMLLPLADSFELFLASPTATREAAWWTPAGLGRILQAVRYMTLHFPVDRNRIFLAGVSDGATGCYAAANTVPGPFAGFVAVSGFGGLLMQLGFTLVPGNLMQRPIYNVSGGRDHLFPLEATNRFLDALQSEGVTVERKVYPDQEHGFDYRGQEFGAIAARLRTWTRPQRRGISWRIVPDYPNVADNLVAWEAVRDVAGMPAVNAYWEKGRLIVRSLGVRAFTFLADSAERQLVVVANGRVEERAMDRTSDMPSLLAAMQQQCYPGALAARLFSAIISQK